MTDARPAPPADTRRPASPADTHRPVPPPGATPPPRSDGAPHPLAPGGAGRAAADALLRAAGAVVPVLLPGEVPAVAVTRHEVLREVLAHPEVAKDACHFAALHDGTVPPGWPLTTFATVDGMITADGADHRRLRGPVTKVFTGRRVAALRPRVVELTAGLLDGLPGAAAADGTVDLRRHFAYPLPMSVICELLGVDAALRDRLHELSNLIVSTADGTQAAHREIIAILTRVAEARRADPGDDLTSALLAAQEEDGDRLSDRELVGTLLLMIIAGHETTLNLITNAVRALCTDRGQLELVRDGRATWDDVVEETLRYDSPVAHFPFRYPVRDLEIGGTVVPRGTPMLASYSAAGRDPDAYGPDADRFDVTRRPAARHLSFGHGPHYCPGAPLARLEATVALEALFTRYPALDLAVPDAELPPHPSFVGNSTHVLPVRLTG
ncbi:Cytochrome P450 [Streptomyces sp. 2224.1]|uniref:cytochrome P450 family protein n=1 Tax=unclassified Streptomyces TaxID=2593676 RepID=UPI000880C8BC|nr:MULTISPECIES: cytochrome P450 [unclassified Streptomyces]PBC84567.1 cytochrome P450 [Streptomyces sp. 2321.6]SDR28884.1 Cytochrome P450 [Streptomyces sp. KS_16]SEB67204.1 Cytochrome P450 [Streptomyces sp. 2224.1]SED36113.1 Cytochrome P450 [Streptomyces sp. 2133.1]SNC70650.1 Cytochrome P450 [Streptomyces sp. 2114.4]